jgi:chemotaxis protein methyltransferase CheR
MATFEISDEELSSLTNSIKIRFGYDFTNYEPKSLKRGFARLIMKHDLGSLLGLWSKILADRDFILGCIDDLTVNLTELFRNPEVWVKIREEIIPSLDQQSSIDIWHAGCSTGEEIYTMAIVLEQYRAYNRSKILATDLSATALAKAMEGSFSNMLHKKYKESFEKYLAIGKFENYFKINERDVVVNDSLKKNILFQRHNLVQDPMDKKFDIIFCRNVMIYFDEKLKMKVLNLFHSSLKPGGYFIIGYYDMMPDAGKELFSLYDASTRIYQKKKQ